LAKRKIFHKRPVPRRAFFFPLDRLRVGQQFSRVRILFTTLFFAFLTALASAADMGRSVVQVLVYSQTPIWDAPWRNNPVAGSSGTGFVIDGDRVMTNAHVVSWAKQIVLRRFQDPRPWLARVEYISHECDLAVLKVDTPGFFDGLKPLPLGGLPKVQSTVVTCGYPAGGKQISYTRGVVSRIEMQNYVHIGNRAFLSVQTDAAINPGNSGGPLVNIYGEVIGINTLIRGVNTGIGFAIPVNLAKRVADMLIEDGKVTRAWLGVSITTLREDADYRDLAVGVEDGVVVRQFVSGGPAENSDLELADVITEVDGNSVKSADELKRELRLKKAGDSVTLGLMRNGKAREIEVETGAFPEEFTAVSRMRRSERKPEADTKAKLLGMTVQNINADLAKRFEVEGEKGVIVTAIENDSVAAEKGISPGDIVTRINSAPVDSVASFKAALEGEDLKKGVIVHLTSEGSQRFEVLKQYE